LINQLSTFFTSKLIEFLQTQSFNQLKHQKKTMEQKTRRIEVDNEFLQLFKLYKNQSEIYSIKFIATLTPKILQCGT